MQKILVVGLGNPGEEYNGTPHNAGFEVIEVLLKKLEEKKVEFKETQTKKLALYDGKTKSRRVILGRPLTFMNKSGNAIRELNEKHKLNAKNFILVHDDADLPMGSIRLSYNSGSAGHKGVEDIIRALKTKEFYRFRIGTMPTVKRPRKRPKSIMNKLVTKKLMGADKQKMEKTVNLCAQLIQDAVIEGVINTGKRNYVV